MDERLLLATRDGLWVAEQADGGWRAERRGLQGRHVTSVMAREGVILAGTTEGVFRSDDGGAAWREASIGLTTRHVRWLAFHPAISDREFAGVESAGVFVSHDGGARWRECPEVAELREGHGWWLPYSDGAGCVRDFAFHGQRGYAAVEVGGLLRSDDAGESWALVEGSPGTTNLSPPPAASLPADVHSVAVHAASSPDLLFAATNGGLYRSEDGGARWVRLYEDCYCRALWLDPTEPDHLLFGPATRRGWIGTIVETRDGGRTWQSGNAGAEHVWSEGTLVERFAQTREWLLALLSDGRLLATSPARLRWQAIVTDAPDIQAVTTMLE